MKYLFTKIFTDTFRSTQSEHLKFIGLPKNQKFNVKVLLIVIVACVSLSCIEYIGKDDGYYLILEFLKKHGFAALSDKISFYIKSQVNNQLFSLAYWVFIILIFYIGLPLLLIKFVFKEKLSNYGFAVGNLFKDYKIYLLFFGFMVPIIIFFSTTDSFQSRYPFYRLSGNETLWPNFWTWQILYFFQFIAVEFFFRGFLVHGLKKQFGYYSILIMTIPYCMIHFGKPFPETIAAIIAGIVLGTLSLKSRTILMGVAIHYTVALSMDLSALWQKGYLLH